MMAAADKIVRHVRLLLDRFRADVLEFRVMCRLKRDHATIESDRDAWNKMSLQSAMRGLDAVNEPDYVLGDLKEIFSPRRHGRLLSFHSRRRESYER